MVCAAGVSHTTQQQLVLLEMVMSASSSRRQLLLLLTVGIQGAKGFLSSPPSRPLATLPHRLYSSPSVAEAPEGLIEVSVRVPTSVSERMSGLGAGASTKAASNKR